MNYWKYVINGIEYYVPNYGHMVMIDSTFKDVRVQPKICSNKITPGTFDDDTIFKVCCNTLKRCMDKLFALVTSKGTSTDPPITEPSDEIKNLISNIKNDIKAPNFDIGYYIERHFSPHKH